VNNELRRMKKAAVLGKFEVILQNLPAVTGEKA
jgi:hypothetical protein